MLLWWGHPLYEPERIDFDALSIPNKAKSKRIRFGDGVSFQAERAGVLICVKQFFLGKRQPHLDLWFSARRWPSHPFDQNHFVQGVLMDLERRLTGNEWHPNFYRMGEVIICAVNQVLEM